MISASNDDAHDTGKRRSMTIGDHEVTKWIAKAADLFVEQEALHDGEISNILEKQGCQVDLAHIITEYLPVVFSEYAIESLGVERLPSYTRRLTDGTQVEVFWQDDPVYRAVQDYKKNQIEKGRWHDYKAIGARAADLDAVSKALDAGNEVKGGVSTIAPTHVLPSDSPWLPTPRK